MKKRLLFTLLTMTLLVISGCNNDVEQEVTNKEELTVVYTSIYPMYDFAKNIGGEHVDVRLMVPPGAEPHDWEPSAKLLAELEKADLFIYNGVQMEIWVDKVLGAIDTSKLVVVEASEGIELLRFKEYNGDEHEDEHEDQHEHGEYDPHIWLNPIKAIEQAKSIKNALVKADDRNKEYYENNLKMFEEKLLNLDKKYEQELSSIENKEIVVTHAAFGYLADRYDLNQIAISGLSPQQEPSASKLAEITRILEDRRIKYVFFEPLTSSKLSEVLANEAGAKTAILNPIDNLTEEEIKSGKNYISTMEQNLETLKNALGE